MLEILASSVSSFLRFDTFSPLVSRRVVYCGGTDLSDIEPSAHEQRVLLDIKHTAKLKVVAYIKNYPECHARTKGRFPENMPGPLQYGDGIKALVTDLLVAQMLPLCRCTELVKAITGIKLSEATCLGYIERLHDSLEPWEAAAKEHLILPALHADETGFRVNKKTGGCT